MSGRYDREFKPETIRLLEEPGSSALVRSISRKGNCWDSAVAESFFHLFKTELVYHVRWQDHMDTYHDLL